ncbi:MAG: PilZ domain-containing protein [Pyrinomonadaceae bacterium]|nr:PilZ domain-containing protein [Pyrinomonadaceae bacterium]MBP6212139.1 PilZ domain-containing protein [Pyrinomonadaceae bacterium]
MTDKDFGEALSPAERRDSDRKKLIVDVRYEGGDGTGIANTRDIGIGGLYMTTSASLDIGMPILMAVSVGGRALDLNGVVVYTDPGHGVGVRFKDVVADDLEFLRSELELD